MSVKYPGNSGVGAAPGDSRLKCILWKNFSRQQNIRRHFQPVNVDRAEATRTERIDMKGKKGIIVYFTRVGNTAFADDVDAVSSASLMTDGANLVGNSELLSEMIANATGYPVYAIKTKNKYSSSYSTTVREAGQEFRGERSCELVNDVPELSEYDTVILVYPLWWWTLPMPVQKLLTENKLDGKTLYSLVTHGGSGFGRGKISLRTNQDHHFTPLEILQGVLH